MKFKSVNKLNKNLIKSSFLEIIFNCKFLNCNCYLYQDIDYKNIEGVSSDLIMDYDIFEFRDDWFFHYFIPISKNKNLLLVGFKGEIPVSFLSFYKPKNFYSDIETILFVISNNLDWESENIFNHTFYWKDQQIVAEYLDLVCGGITDFLPLHWSNPRYNNKKNWDEDWFKKTSFYYNVYLKKYKLKDNFENKKLFVLDFDKYYN